MTNVNSVATAQVGNGHASHAMVLDCILADIEKDDQGNTVFDSNGDAKLKNYSFKFKNTYRNNKEIILEAGKIEYTREFTFILYSDDAHSPTIFYYINIDFVPSKKRYSKKRYWMMGGCFN